MNYDNELFELCKEVYEKTLWNVGIDKGIDTVWCHGNITRLPIKIDTSDFHQHVPLYTSDYLLEKLGDAELQEVSLYRCHHQDSSMNWCAIYDEQEYGGAKLFEYHDTPLKALLKLTLALIEAGEL